MFCISLRTICAGFILKILHLLYTKEISNNEITTTRDNNKTQIRDSMGHLPSNLLLFKPGRPKLLQTISSVLHTLDLHYSYTRVHPRLDYTHRQLLDLNVNPLHVLSPNSLAEVNVEESR